jgi:hypothetical protein
MGRIEAFTAQLSEPTKETASLDQVSANVICLRG